MFLGKYRRIMILASALPIMQQLSGINTVVFYSSDVRHPASSSLLLLNMHRLAPAQASWFPAPQCSSVLPVQGESSRSKSVAS